MNAKTLILLLLAGACAGGAGAKGLSPATRAMLESVGRTEAKADGRSKAPSVKTNADMVRLFMKYNDASALDSIEAVGGIFTELPVAGLVTVSLPASELEHVGSMPQVEYLEVGGTVSLLNDEVRRYADVDALHDGLRTDVPYTGKGVVLGMIDAGLEFGHVNFLAADSVTSRIKRVWVQTGMGKAPAGFNYGAEYATPEQITGALYDSSSTFHGTHTTGIAGGSDHRSKYYGMAPDVDIVFVSFGTTAQIADGIKYIFDYADEVGKPCVINMSLGAHEGPHDGTSYLDRVIDASVGPGRIIVGSVGNEGANTMHASKTFTAGDTELKTMLDTNPDEARVDIWGEAGADMTVTVGVVNAVKGKIVAESQEFTPESANGIFVCDYDETLADVSFQVFPSRTEDGRPNVLVRVFGGSKDFSSSRKTFVKVKGTEGTSVHMWNVGAENFAVTNRAGWTSGDNACTAGEVGGTANRIISVGSFNSRKIIPYYMIPGAEVNLENYAGAYTLEELSSFSSHGPTADGRMKPEVVAGGMFVVSSISRYAMQQFDPENCVDRVYGPNGKDYYYSFEAGTSMASPAVAGIVAQWLEANPELTPENVVEVLKKTCEVDRYTGSRGNNNAGYGKVKALTGLRYILKTEFTGLGEVAAPEESRVWTEGGELCVAASADGVLTLTSLNGIRVLSAPVKAGFNSVDVNSVARGIYVVSLPDGTNAKIIL